jgi:prepilin signal peptidase PulO-like enzyme (type II secretory pathway)
MMDDRVVVSVILGVLGLVVGSFVGATMWRLRAWQLRTDTDSGEKVDSKDKRQVSKLQKKSLVSDRSVCLHCGHALRWYDLIPLLSWVLIGGKCRYCRKQIGLLEPFIEIGMATFFVASFLFWPSSLGAPLEVTRFVLWLVSGAALALLFAYDSKWFLLPNRIVFPLIGLGLLNSLIVLYEHQFSINVIADIVYSCLILSGLYYLIYLVSQRQWVGFGDVKLGLALALLLANWQLAILALFLANIIGTLIVLPMILGGRIRRQAHIPFGPLLISGWFLAGLFGPYIVKWYMSFTLGV